MAKNKTKRKARIDFTDIDDVDCVLHAEMGLYSRAIGAKLGLSAGQAQHRVALGGASQARRDWRNGTSPLYRKLSNQVFKGNRESEQKRLVREYVKIRSKQIKERAEIVRQRRAKAKAKRKARS